MPEEQAFCVLVYIMYKRKLRDLFQERLNNLCMKVFQLNRVMEVCLYCCKNYTEKKLPVKEAFGFPCLHSNRRA